MADSHCFSENFLSGKGLSLQPEIALLFSLTWKAQVPGHDTQRYVHSCLGLVPLLIQPDVTPHYPSGSPPFQIKMLSDRKRELEHRLSATLEENDLLQGTVEELQDRVLILERQGHDKDLQVQSRDIVLQD